MASDKRTCVVQVRQHQNSSCTVHAVYAEDAIGDSTFRRRYQKFKEGDKWCQDPINCGRSSFFGKEVLDQVKKQSDSNDARISQHLQHSSDNNR